MEMAIDNDHEGVERVRLLPFALRVDRAYIDAECSQASVVDGVGEALHGVP
jgi:hypothetical protein